MKPKVQTGCRQKTDETKCCVLTQCVVLGAQLNQVARNVTTNELTNWPRYKYLRAADGTFHNPFDRGCRANCAEVCAPARSAPSPAVLPADACEKMSLLHMELNGSHQA
jgi:hypothetical protein